ncbi:hypothetical protein [Vibrio parahaemolyticus]|uniref:hypothetical protein n=2 Tax=Vibrio parahaemolyticus TaxID=670 RepID=UPI00111F23D8|nr:hypothetical protein [Vibrio parahaemolyticus]
MKFLRPKYLGSLLFLVFIGMWLAKVYQWLTLPLLGSFFLLMIAILESKQERIMKGTSLILFGILFGIFLPEALIPNQEFAKSLPPDMVGKMEIFKNLAVFSCSGAGGSIIAGHAERFLADIEKSAPQQISGVDHSNEIQALHREVMKLKRYFVYFSGVVVFLLMSLLLINVI